MNTFAQILDAARAAGPARFVVAQAADDTILEALAEAQTMGFAEPVLVGVRAEIEAAAAQRSVSIDGWKIVETPTREDSAAEAVRIVARGGR